MKRRRFDSDDDEDELVVTGPASDTQAFGEYAYTSAHSRDVLRDMGMASSSSSERAAPQNPDSRAASSPREAEAQLVSTHDDGARSDPPAAVHLETSSCPLDQDLPPALLGLMGDTLLSIYAVPLTYVNAQRSVDDKLLAQYLPFKESPSTQRVLLALDDDVPANPAGSPYGITPGWRWDGVRRGTAATEDIDGKDHPSPYL